MAAPADRAARGRRGPAPAFDRAEVLDRLMTLFWEQGYDRTSHDDMRARTGLSGSSLYNAFGDKTAIFASALARYFDMTASLTTPLLRGSGGLEDLRAFVDRVAEHAAGDGTPAGCLMVSTIGQPAGRAPAARAHTRAYRDRLRTALAAAVERAVARGEIANGDTAARVALLLSAYSGTMLAAADDPGGTEAPDTARGLRTLLDDWAAPAPPVGPTGPVATTGA